MEKYVNVDSGEDIVSKPRTRCGCEAKFRIHVDINSNRWWVACFTNDHNHELVSEVHCGFFLRKYIVDCLLHTR
jgi:hypothetical protein